MSEEKKEVVAEQPQKEEVDYKSLYESSINDHEETKKQLSSLAAHKDKLLNETKKAKQERESVESSAKKTVEDLAKELHDIRQSRRHERLQNSAFKIANELADGFNAEILSDFIVKNLDDVSDETGSLSGNVIDEIKHNFKNNEKFKALLRGTKANGGGAPGGQHGVSEGKILTRSKFNEMNMDQKRQFLKTGTLVDD